MRITVGELQMLVGSCVHQTYIRSHVTTNCYREVCHISHGFIFTKGANISGAHCEYFSLLLELQVV